MKRRPSPVFKLFRKFNPFWLQVPLPGGSKVIGRVAKCLGPVMSGPVVVLGVLLIVSAVCAIAMQPGMFVGNLAGVFHSGRWWWLLGTWLVLKVMHELGHAIACYRMGGEVHDCGVVFVLGAPLAYVDVSSCWRMASRVRRIAVSSAGMFVELCVASIATWVFLSSDDPFVQDTSYNVLVTAGLSTLLFNANVLMRFDGYFILADAVDIPNLATESAATLTRMARRWIVGEATSVAQITGWRGVLVSVYGCSALAWRVSVCVCLAIAASVMFEGAGVLLSVAGVVLWVGMPGVKLGNYLHSLRQCDPPRFYRAIVLGGGLVFVAVVSVFALPIPSRVRTPVITRFAPEASVRAPASGFIEDIAVRDGDMVEIGDRLLTLRNWELGSMLGELEIEAERIELELQGAAGRQEEGKRQVLRRTAELLQTRLEPVRRRVNSLTIRAPRAGRVVARNLESRLGEYADEGDPLMIVAAAADREWVTLIEPRQIEQVRACVGRDVRVVSFGNQRYQSQLVGVEPRATDRLTVPALAAVHGGPVATRTDELSGSAKDTSLRLLQPHFYGWLDVDTGTEMLPVGIRMWADCGYRTQSLASRFREWVRSLSERAVP